jgi:magnesium chelatase subunit D
LSEQPAIATPWRRASLAATLFALDPLGSGLLVRANAGPARDALLEQLAAELAPRKLTRMPAEIADDRLIGGLDVAATLRAGKPIAETGVLANADGGVIAVAMAERMRGSVAARLNVALDRGEVALQRDGLSRVWPARLGLVALDEGLEDEATPLALAERLAFWVDLDAVSHRDIEPPVFASDEFREARALLSRVAASASAISTLVTISAELGVASLRAPLFALRAARAVAAFRGALEVEDEDIELAAALVLGPRATRAPAETEPPPPDDASPDANEDQDGEDQSPRKLEDRVLEAARAAIPPGLLASLAAGRMARARTGGDGKSGEEAASSARGRPLEARPGSLAKGRLALVATLRAAAPWRALRDPESRDPRRIIVRPEDFRIVRYRRPRGATTIFVVDASGSLAMNRLAEVKGAIELLLADCYVRRDHVALISFRGPGSEMALPPTRSTARARRALTGLPGGGGTPIAAGLDAALGLADVVRRKGQTPLIVLMSDGRANIGRGGATGRPQAMSDALDAARRIRAAGFACLAIDTSPPSARDDAPARGLAEAMGGAYLKLPLVDAIELNAAVRGARP